MRSVAPASRRCLRNKGPELAAFFYLRKLGSMVVARNWKSGRSPGDIDLIAWEGETLCFVHVGIARADRLQRRHPLAQVAVQTGCCGALLLTTSTKPRYPECRPAWT